MAHLWLRNDSEQWAVMPLEEGAFTLMASPPKALRKRLRESEAINDVLLLRAHEGAAAAWVLVAGARARVSVNGACVNTGLRVLADRDEIRVADAECIYFSTETLSRVEEFPGNDQTLFCPRCKQEIENGSLAVKCPGCGVWHHQTEELNCWTYSEVCALCSQATSLETGFRWTPEEL